MTSFKIYIINRPTFYYPTRYWGAICIPHGINGLIGEWQFCATPIEERGFAKLIFKYHLDSKLK